MAGEASEDETGMLSYESATTLDEAHYLFWKIL
jgi:hypothetical protein